MTKKRELEELEQRMSRADAIDYLRAQKRVITELEAEVEDYQDFSFEENNKLSVIL